MNLALFLKIFSHVVLVLFFGTQAKANSTCASRFQTLSDLATTASLAEEFSTVYHSQYRPGRCRQNVEALIDLARKNGRSLSRTNILTITNGGWSTFGMINARHARESGILRPPARPHFRSTNLPGEANWEYHVVLEQDGWIYDLDFGDTAQPLPIRDYFNKMFLTTERVPGARVLVKPQERMTDYLIEVTPALNQSQRSSGTPLKDFLAR